MRFIERFISVIFIVFYFTSCVSIKEIKNLPPSALKEISKTSFDGCYLNHYISLEGDKSTNARKETLTQILSELRDTKLKMSTYSDSAFVQLKFYDETLSIEISENNEIKEVYQLPAKIENNYLSIKRKFFLVPIPMFLFGYDHKIFLCINNKGNLVAKYGYSHGGWILVMANGHEGMTSLEYRKIK